MDKLYGLINAQWPILGAALGLPLLGKLVRIAGTMVAAKLLLHWTELVITRVFAPHTKQTMAQIQKAKTLSGLLKSLARYIVYFIAGLTILAIFDVPTTSIIASAGIVGLAVGFGAQNLVRDVLTGFFILFEDQYAVGDYIATAGVAGTVEEIGLRVTKLRDFGGELHTIPNGSIERVTNHSRGRMRAMVDISVADEERLDKVLKLLDEACQQVKNEMQTVIIDGPDVLGVVAFGPCEMVIRVLARTAPMEQWAVERALRKRIKEAFDREGVHFPHPKRVLVQHKEEA